MEQPRNATPIDLTDQTDANDQQRAERVAHIVTQVARHFGPAGGENFPTKATILALENDAADSRAARLIVADAIEEAMARLLADEDAPVSPLANAGDDLRRWLEERFEQVSASAIIPPIARDLLTSALDDVSWAAVAGAFTPARDELYQQVRRAALAILSECHAERHAERAAEWQRAQRELDASITFDRPPSPPRPEDL